MNCVLLNLILFVSFIFYVMSSSSCVSHDRFIKKKFSSGDKTDTRVGMVQICQYQNPVLGLYIR